MKERSKQIDLLIWNGIDPSKINFRILAGWGQDRPLTKLEIENYLLELDDERFELALGSLNWKLLNFVQGKPKFDFSFKSVWLPVIGAWTIVIVIFFLTWLSCSSGYVRCSGESGMGPALFSFFSVFCAFTFTILWLLYVIMRGLRDK